MVSRGRPLCIWDSVVAVALDEVLDAILDNGGPLRSFVTKSPVLQDILVQIQIAINSEGLPPDETRRLRKALVALDPTSST